MDKNERYAQLGKEICILKIWLEQISAKHSNTNKSSNIFSNIRECNRGKQILSETNGEASVAIYDVFDRLAASQEIIRQNEQMLMAEKNRLKALGDNFPNGCLFRCQIDATQLKLSDSKQAWLDHLTFTYASAAWEKLTNVPFALAMSDTCVPFMKIHPDDLTAFRSTLFKSLLECSDLNEDIRYYRTDIDIRWFQISLSPRIENGSVVCDGFILDITGRKQAEEELAVYRRELEHLVAKRTEELGAVNEELQAANEELFSINEELRRNNDCLQHEITVRKEVMQKLEEGEQRFRNFIEQSFEGIMILDKEGRVIEWNHSLERISGIPCHEALGKYEWDLLKTLLTGDDLKPEALSRLYHSRKEYLEGGSLREPVVEELILHLPNGQMRYVRVSIFPISIGGTCFFGRILRDNTGKMLVDIELKKYRTQLEEMVEVKTRELTRAKEKAEESDKLKSAFLANMSHEIRTPLSGIVSFINILNSGDLTPEIWQESIAIVNNCSSQLVQLFDDIIDVAKIEARQLEIHPVPIRVNELMNELLTFFKTHLQTTHKKRIALILDTSNLIDSCVILSSRL